ncbi:phytanoyl-CoA dioxygenase family protein [Sphingomonas colocasiae]|uniref:phytanoyl-CoA dioxygenase family protein n=1 Tax=Sphingomonas colocasiae TaxID=1848973 RepID=UPI001FE5C89A|nr:phytanoyl-CoA dioxygenase family protein [Sphingomonas colocasiae]
MIDAVADQGAAARAKADLAASGVAVVTDVLSPERLAAVRAAVQLAIDNDRASGRQVSGYSFDPDDHNIRLWDLILRDRIFRDLAEHPLALDLVAHCLGDDFALSNFTGNITRPGGGRMYMHADQGFLPAPWPPYPMSVNVGWAIDDFTFENGGTIYVPGTHDRTEGPRPEGGYPDERAVECRAGSFFVMDGRVWHQTGANVSQNIERTGLFAYYVRPFIVPQRPWARIIPPEMEAEFTPSLWRRLGLADLPILTLRSSSAQTG